MNKNQNTYSDTAADGRAAGMELSPEALPGAFQELNEYKAAMEARIKELDEKERKLNLSQLYVDASKLLNEAGMSLDLLPILVGPDLESTQKNIITLKGILDTAIDNAVKADRAKHFVGRAIPAGNSKTFDSFNGDSEKIGKIINGR